MLKGILDTTFYAVPVRRDVSLEIALGNLADTESFHVRFDTRAAHTAPRRSGAVVDVCMFTLSEAPTDVELAAAYLQRRLAPDPVAQLALYAQRPNVTERSPSATHWRIDGTHWGYLVVSTYGGVTYVTVGIMGEGDTHGNVHDAGVLFAGTPLAHY